MKPPHHQKLFPCDCSPLHADFVYALWYSLHSIKPVCHWWTWIFDCLYIVHQSWTKLIDITTHNNSALLYSTQYTLSLLSIDCNKENEEEILYMGGMHATERSKGEGILNTIKNCTLKTWFFSVKKSRIVSIFNYVTLKLFYLQSLKKLNHPNIVKLREVRKKILWKSNMTTFLLLKQLQFMISLIRHDL